MFNKNFIKEHNNNFIKVINTPFVNNYYEIFVSGDNYIFVNQFERKFFKIGRVKEVKSNKSFKERKKTEVLCQ